MSQEKKLPGDQLSVYTIMTGADSLHTAFLCCKDPAAQNHAAMVLGKIKVISE